LSGRTSAQKSALISELAGAAKRALGVPDEAIRIVLAEIPPENWGVGSLTMAALQAALRADRTSD
jgi:4-oxalocrotonate tautomerase